MRLLQIKASAGSGKTYDLTRRFLMRLQSMHADQPVSGIFNVGDEAWGDIIAITFTNAAAAEMNQRVINTLKKIALGLDCPPGITLTREEARHRLASILRNFSNLNIRTIDSLLHMIVRAAAIDLRLPPDFEPVFASEDALAPVLDALMEDAQNNDDSPMYALLEQACRSLVYTSESKGFLVGEKLVRRLRPLLDGALLHEYGGLTPPEELERLWRHLNSLPRSSAATLSGLLQNSGLSCNSRMLDALDRLAAGDEKALESSYWGKAALDDCLNKASRGTATAEQERAFTALCTAVQRRNTSGKLIKGALGQVPFITLATALAAGFSAQISAEGKLPAILIPHKALEVLSGENGVPDVVCRLGSRLSHILMDEFQDTSGIQWRALKPLVIEALSRGGSLTWVGDVKQAIYSWRGGDSRLFDAVAADPEIVGLLEEGKAAAAPLPVNWRSKKILVEHNNTLFSQLARPEIVEQILKGTLSAETPDAFVQEAAASLERAFSGAAQEARHTEGGYISILPVQGGNMAELRDNVLDELLHLLLENIGRRRPWSDVAILVRSNSTASDVAEHLMAAGIPVVTENSLLLAGHPLIRQLVAFLHFLNAPNDDIAFLSCMAGSLVSDHPAARAGGLSVSALMDMASVSHTVPLSILFRDRFPECWKKLVAPFVQQAGLMTPYDMVQEWFTRLDVFQRYPAEDTFLRRFLEVLAAAENREQGTLSTFLEHWEEKGGEEKVPMAEGLDAVRIMTIHKAKGLEFPVVIVPWMSFTYKVDAVPVPVECGEMRLMPPCRKETGAPYYTALITALQECFNLVYVAWTRAREELYAFHTGTSGRRTVNSIIPALDILLEQAGMVPPYSAGELACCDHPALPGETGEPAGSGEAGTPDAAGSAAAEVSDAAEAAGTEAGAGTSGATGEAGTPDAAGSAAAEASSAAETAGTGAEAETSGSGEAGTPDAAAPIWSDWRPMRWLPRLKVFRNPLNEMEFSAKDRGTLLHACLEHLPLTGDIPRDVAHASSTVQYIIDTFPKPVPADADFRKDLVRAVRWFASLPDAHIWRRNAIPEQSLLDSRGHLHRVDLLLENPDGYLVIEYKTGQPRDSHIPQVRRYLGLLNAATGRSASGVLVYLDLQQVQPVLTEGPPAARGSAS